MTADTDHALLLRFQQGDSRALEQLLGQYEKRVYRFGLRMCGNEADAHDVLQETLLSAFRNLRTFRHDARLSTWLFQVARSFCIKQRRRHQGEPSSHDSLTEPHAQQVADASEPADVRVHAAEMSQVIQRAMTQLSPEHREVIVLRDIEGLSAEEAADVVGLEVGALKSKLHRARMALKSQLSILLAEPEADAGCPELASELAAYAASEIDQAACERIEAHLKTCSRCSQTCEGLKRTVSLCRELPGGDVPNAIRQAVRRALEEAQAAASHR